MSKGTIIRSIIIFVVMGFSYTGAGDAEKPSAFVKEQFQLAEQGDAKAQYYLGQCYATGEGVLLDDKEAVKWFIKSAEQGDAKAQHNLGNSYAKSLFIPPQLPYAALSLIIQLMTSCTRYNPPPYPYVRLSLIVQSMTSRTLYTPPPDTTAVLPLRC